MSLLASFPQFRSLLAVPFLAAMLVFPASAETTPNGTPAQVESKAATSETDTDAAPKPPHAVTEDSNQEAVEEPDAATGDDATEDPNAATAPVAPEQPKSTILIDVDKESQEMTVFIDGVQQYSWPVSTGLRGYSTPSGSYTASSMNEIWYSKQWDNAPMPHAIFFTKKGHAIHATQETKKLGNPASHGCVRLAPQNAATLFELVKATDLENVQVVLSGTTKGGEGPKVASPGPGRQYDGYPPPWFEPGNGYYPPQQKKRRGLFGKRWFQPYGPQGYYAPRGNTYYRRGGSPRDY